MEINVREDRAGDTSSTCRARSTADTAAAAQAQILPLAASADKLLLEMTGVTFMSSAGPAAAAVHLPPCRHSGGQRRARRPVRGPARYYGDDGFLGFFATFDTSTGALEMQALTRRRTEPTANGTHRRSTHHTHGGYQLRMDGRFPSARPSCRAASISRCSRAMRPPVPWCSSRKAAPTRAPRFHSRMSFASGTSTP